MDERFDIDTAFEDFVSTKDGLQGGTDIINLTKGSLDTLPDRIRKDFIAGWIHGRAFRHRHGLRGLRLDQGQPPGGHGHHQLDQGQPRHAARSYQERFYGRGPGVRRKKLPRQRPTRPGRERTREQRADSSSNRILSLRRPGGFAQYQGRRRPLSPKTTELARVLRHHSSALNLILTVSHSSIRLHEHVLGPLSLPLHHPYLRLWPVVAVQGAP